VCTLAAPPTASIKTRRNSPTWRAARPTARRSSLETCMHDQTVEDLVWTASDKKSYGEDLDEGFINP
jgi:hypothetical protein